MFQVSAISAFSDNYIWMIHGSDNQVAVVDPGAAQPVIEALQECGKTLAAILITHHHNDHTGGVNELLERHQVPVYGPENCKYSGITRPLKDADNIELFNRSLSIKTVPGHTLDHICYLNETAGGAQIFCGDTLFLAGCGRVFEGSMGQMLKAMHYFKQLREDTKIYCTHEYSLSNLAFAQSVEPDNLYIQQQIEHCSNLRVEGKPTLPTDIASELLINPFLRCDNPDIQHTAALYSKKTVNSELDTFTVLRNWKNIF
ncbi:hydroxyacylglutathione hydrolase ['Osedax' symbiont bacterium Rs2_46_30_T18]|nr:hydroxyacylglutathione hydrolase ['Osedax' symbiont bacterium Rs2_46_30_T18]